MQRLVKAASVAATLFFVAPVASANEDDETLEFFLSKSELVVLGKITSEPVGLISESGFPITVASFKSRTSLRATPN